MQCCRRFLSQQTWSLKCKTFDQKQFSCFLKDNFITCTCSAQLIYQFNNFISVQIFLCCMNIIALVLHKPRKLWLCKKVKLWVKRPVCIRVRVQIRKCFYCQILRNKKCIFLFDIRKLEAMLHVLLTERAKNGSILLYLFASQNGISPDPFQLYKSPEQAKDLKICKNGDLGTI